MTETTPGFETRAIHAGQEPDAATGAVNVPIHQSSTFAQDAIGALRGGYEYGRAGNPTRDALQEQLAAIEGARHAFSFSSGLAAEDALIRALLGPGDRIVIGDDVYGGTYRLIDRVLGAWGVRHEVVDMTDLEAVRRTVTGDSTALVWVETPSNPMMTISDIAGLAAIAHEAGARLVVDNTFASPYLQNPLALGADIVVHSTPKYIGGHSDVIGGAVMLDDDEAAERIRFVQFAVGAVSAPLDAFLTMRGIKTLGVRMDRHSENAQAIAEWLRGREGVGTVHYPGLPDHPGHQLAAAQMRGFGGMLTVSFTGGAAAARTVAESTRLFTLAESLGGVESLVNHPAQMTHASVQGTELAVGDDLLRFSVGLESLPDLIADLDQALARL
jgi:cystathionine gamma-synthase